MITETPDPNTLGGPAGYPSARRRRRGRPAIHDRLMGKLAAARGRR